MFAFSIKDPQSYNHHRQARDKPAGTRGFTGLLLAIFFPTLAILIYHPTKVKINPPDIVVNLTC
jgi:hypothetical protein